MPFISAVIIDDQLEYDFDLNMMKMIFTFKFYITKLEVHIAIIKYYEFITKLYYHLKYNSIYE